MLFCNHEKARLEGGEGWTEAAHTGERLSAPAACVAPGVAVTIPQQGGRGPSEEQAGGGWGVGCTSKNPTPRQS